MKMSSTGYIFQEIDKRSNKILLSYATFITIPTQPMIINISNTFRLNSYRICYIIIGRFVCILVKKIYDNKYLYTGYIKSFTFIRNEQLGSLSGIGHYVPVIGIDKKWSIDNLIYIIYKNLLDNVNLNINYDEFYHIIKMTNLTNPAYLNDDDNGLDSGETEYNCQQWIKEEF
jgi:hypothetical protein